MRARLFPIALLTFACYASAEPVCHLEEGPTTESNGHWEVNLGGLDLSGPVEAPVWYRLRVSAGADSDQGWLFQPAELSQGGQGCTWRGDCLTREENDCLVPLRGQRAMVWGFDADVEAFRGSTAVVRLSAVGIKGHPEEDPFWTGETAELELVYRCED